MHVARLPLNLQDFAGSQPSQVCYKHIETVIERHCLSDVEQIDYNAKSSIDLSKWSININNTELLGEWLRQYVAYVIDVKTDVKKPS